jgi:hypothetical protein
MAHYMNLYHLDRTPADVTAGFRTVVDLATDKYRMTALNGEPLLFEKDGQFFHDVFLPSGENTPRGLAVVLAECMTVMCGHCHVIETETATEIVFRFGG